MAKTSVNVTELEFAASHIEAGEDLVVFCLFDHHEAMVLSLGLIRFGGHLPKGEYDVDHDGDAGQADAAELHG